MFLSPLAWLQRNWWSGVRRLLLLVIATYGLATIAALLLIWTVSDHFSPVGLLSYVIHLFLAPTLVLLPICLLWRRWWIAALMLPSMAMLLVSYGTLLLPGRADAQRHGPQLTVLSFNIDRDATSLAPILDVIREADADIVAIQEVTHASATQIRQQLGERYPYMALHPANSFRSPGPGGQGILSRYPIIKDDYVVLERDYQRVVVDVDGTPVVVYSIHLVQPLAIRPGRFRFEDHTWEINRILQRATAESLPVILAGDFNMTDQSDDYGRVRAEFTDAFREAGRGFGFTYPGERKRPFRLIRLPNIAFLRIDYIFYSDGLIALDADTLDSGGADHRPLRVRFRLGE